MSAAGRRVLVSGATGLVGGALTTALAQAGDRVLALSRSPARAAAGLPAGAEAVGWDGREPPAEALARADAVVHLAGEPIFGGLPTRQRRQRIRDSRVDSTRRIAAALSALPPAERPRVLLCASAVGYYGSRGEERLPEEAPPGSGFLAEVCQEWEAAARGAAGVRVVSLRTGIVLSRAGGALPLMALPFRLGLGGPLGDGRQWFPWVHLDDVVGLLRRALDADEISGALNAVAPEPVRNRELTRTLGQLLSRPSLLRVPAFALRAALGELADELLGSRRVVPRVALDAGHSFAHATLEPALRAELAGPVPP